MPRNIEADHQQFRRVIEGNLRKALKKFINTGKFVVQRDKNGRVSIPLRKIDIPHIVYGEGDGGIGRGPGKPGDVLKKDNPDKGPQAGQEEGEGITVSVDLEDILLFMQNELELPDLKPKENETYEEIRIKYNDISLVGPESLRHNRRTMLQALKRLTSSGKSEELYNIPGYAVPVKMITPINSDRRYRQYKEIKIPSSNAVIMFGRDGSGSVDEYKCNIINDMCWWVNVWIKRFYSKVERCFFWHDTVAQEVDEEKFYNYRYGGGTTCSSCLKLMAEQFKDRFNPDKWNVYCFYFTDGENWNDDNKEFLNVINTNFTPDVCNLFGLTQVMCWNYGTSIKKYIENNIKSDVKNVRLVSIGPEETPDYLAETYEPTVMTDDDRNEQVKSAIRALLGVR